MVCSKYASKHIFNSDGVLTNSSFSCSGEEQVCGVVTEPEQLDTAKQLSVKQWIYGYTLAAYHVGVNAHIQLHFANT
jgi:hypothetical protein